MRSMLRRCILHLAVVTPIFLGVQESQAGDIPSFPEIIAHRGSSYTAPENTMAAVHLAWEQNVHTVEVDVYLTLDNQVVCLHDSTLKRTAGVDKRVEDCTWDEIKDLDVGSWKGPQYAGETIPLIEDVIATIPEGKRLFIDIKSGPAIVPPLKAIIEASGKQDQIVIIAFSYDTLVAFREAMPDITLKWLVNSEDYPTKIAQAVEAGFNALNSSHPGVTREFVLASQEAGMELFVWTVNDIEIAKRMKEIGVAGITTDIPDRLIEEFYFSTQESADLEQADSTL